MRTHITSVGIGVFMLIAGLVLFFAFGEVQTPVIGLRQLGVVLAVLGVVEVSVSGFALLRAKR